MVGGLLLVMEKANLIFDAVLTTFFLHFCLSAVYSGLGELCFMWILKFSLFFLAVVVVAEYLSLKLEQKEISVKHLFTNLIGDAKPMKRVNSDCQIGV